MEKVTLKDIAEKASVSIATVSNVLNHQYHKVSKEMIEKIETIVKELNYSPNLNAKALVSNKSRLVSVIFYDEGSEYNFSDPFAAELLAGLEKIAKQHQFFILLHNVNSIHEVDVLRRNWTFAGHIAVGFNDQVALELMQTLSEPLIFIDTYFSEQDYRLVETNEHVHLLNSTDYTDAIIATQYLIDRQLVRIAFLTYHSNFNRPSVIQQRYLGAKASLENFGKQLDPSAIFF